MVTAFLQFLLDCLGGLLVLVLYALPNSPFVGLYNLSLDYEWLQYLSWIIPIHEIIATSEIWLTSVALFYLYSVVLRWIRAIN